MVYCITKMRTDFIVASARIPRDALQSLDKVAMLRGQTRSDLVRLFAENIKSFLVFLEGVKETGAPLDGNVSEWFANQLPSDVTLGTLIWLRDVMSKALEMKMGEITSKTSDLRIEKAKPGGGTS